MSEKTRTLAEHRSSRVLRHIVDAQQTFELHLGRELAVNPTDLAAMEQLINSGPLGPSELARRLRISPPAATAVVDRLEALGHATRAVNPTDRRGIVVVPAKASVARALDILRPLIADIDEAFEGFDPDQQAAISAYLDRVAEIYDRHSPE